MRGRVASVLAVVVVLATACSADDGSRERSAAPTPTGAADDGGTYLALGDSVPFGYRPGATADYPDPSRFVGYPELVGQDLGLDVVNAACPGETTSSFLDPTAPNLGCEATPESPGGYRTSFPLHVDYASADQSQLDFAVRTLKDDDSIELVTLQIGANDAFLCRLTTPSGCTDPADSGALAQTVRDNVTTILKALREDGGYDGQIVVVTYYALDYSGEAGAAGQALGSGIADIATANGADVADGFAAFREKALAAGGSAITAGLVLPDDVHPTAEGHRLLADAVLAVVD